MIVVCDIGNSAVHFGIYDKTGISYKKNIVHNRKEPSGFLKEEIEKWWSNSEHKTSIKAFVYASVYTPLEDYITSFWQAELPVFKLDSSMDAGIKIDYAPRASFGVDRFVNIVGFIARYTPPGIIIDIGSALTIDVINSNGEFDGGLIYPGPALSAGALHANTALLPEVSLSPLCRHRGKTTVQSIQYGIFSVYLHYIDALISQIRNEFSPNTVSVVATGGWSSVWNKEWKNTITFDPDLTLRGIGDAYCRIKNHNF
ncbi:type III pantothenate kinase [bacterium]|nr:type III pantothenate kinase [bacterium]MCP5462699.1 type III pantothenate kinase [bacterium]